MNIIDNIRQLVADVHAVVADLKHCVAMVTGTPVDALTIQTPRQVLGTVTRGDGTPEPKSPP